VEKFRAFLDRLFIVTVILGVIGLTIGLMGGAFPINFNPSSQNIKFDLAHVGWRPMDPATGTLKINFDKEHIQKGWGSLQYDYKPVRGKVSPGIVCDNVAMESLTMISFWMKAKHESVWLFQIKRKSDNKPFNMPFKVGKKWKQYTITLDEMKHRQGFKGKFNINDFQKHMQFIDMNPRYDENTVWLDDIKIVRW
jgi:hypothetical protein